MLVPVGYLVMVAAQLPPARILELALEPRTLALARPFDRARADRDARQRA
jgi:hypothetical protein